MVSNQQKREKYPSYLKIRALMKNLGLTQHIPNSKPHSRLCFSVLCTIPGYKNDDKVDETLLSFLTHIHPTTKECPKWDICGFLSQAISQQLTEFPSLKIFRYPSCLFFLFLYQNIKQFDTLELRILDEQGREILVYEWNPLFLRQKNNSNY